MKTIFDGGFAAKCPEGEAWQYLTENSRWDCSGDIAWTQSFVMPEVETEDAVGLIFMPYNAMDNTDSFPNFVYEEDETGNLAPGSAGWLSYPVAYDEAEHRSGSSDLDELEAVCWEGDVFDKPEDISNPPEDQSTTGVITKNVPVNPQYPFGIAAEMEHNGNYACSWNFTTTGGEEIAEVGNTVPLHQYATTNPDPNNENEQVAFEFSQYDHGPEDTDPGLQLLTPYTKEGLLGQMQEWDSLN